MELLCIVAGMRKIERWEPSSAGAFLVGWHEAAGDLTGWIGRGVCGDAAVSMVSIADALQWLTLVRQVGTAGDFTSTNGQGDTA